LPTLTSGIPKEETDIENTNNASFSTSHLAQCKNASQRERTGSELDPFSLTLSSKKTLLVSRSLALCLPCLPPFISASPLLFLFQIRKAQSSADVSSLTDDINAKAAFKYNPILEEQVR